MMQHGARVLCAVAIGAALAGCFPHQNVAMRGGVDWVSVSYVGDVAETLSLARQHCAQYEREPVLRSAKDNTAVYSCIRVNAAP
jgi:hypothetical protein